MNSSSGAGRSILGLNNVLYLCALLVQGTISVVFAQQVTGQLGSASATTSLNGKQLPESPPSFGGVIKHSAKDSTPWWPPRVGNRAIYHDGWVAATTPPSPSWFIGAGKFPIDQYHWELYNIGEDYSEYNDLATSNPAKLKEMQALFETEAAKYQVLPLDNSGFTRLLTARPSAVAGKTVFTYTCENVGIPVGNAPSILDKDYTITAEVTILAGGADGMIATLGGRFGGYGLFLSQSHNWWLRCKLVKVAVWTVFTLGLLLTWLARHWR